MSNKRKIIRDVDVEAIKDKGNACYLERDYKSAIIHYSAAIRICSNISILFSNRSRCYFMLKDYENSFKDAQQSINIDNNNLKAHLLQIRSLAYISKQSLNLEKIFKSLECCNVAFNLAKTLGLHEFIDACKSIKKKIKLMIFLKRVEKFNYEVSRVRNYYKNVVKNSRMQALLNKYLKEKPLKPISDNFICPITLALFVNPLITECGHSYDYDSLVSHFSKMGVSDPITRRGINPNRVFKNNALVKAVKWVHKSQPWTVYSETPMNSLEVEL